MENFFTRKIDKGSAAIIIIATIFISFLVLIREAERLGYEFSFPIKLVSPQISSPIDKIGEVEKFSSEKEFKDYLQQAASEASGISLGGMGGADRTTMMPETGMILQTKEGTQAPDRVSQTTVQVAGIDEPDIVKTDGKEIYFSPRQIWRILDWGMRMESGMMPPYYPKVETKIIKAFPPEELAQDSKITDKSGDLLLSGNNLVVFSAASNEILGYDVSNPKDPKEKWKTKLENNSGIVSARLYNNKIYLVLRQSINETSPCPIKPLTAGSQPLIIDCRDVYHPLSPVPVDTTFIAMVLNPSSGAVEKNISFIGSSGSSVVYMSESSIYITYSYYESMTRFFTNFLKEKAQKLVPAGLIEKMEKLESYDLSQQSKLYEAQFIWQKYFASLSNDDRLKTENEINNGLSSYYKTHQRSLEKTGIVKIKLDKFNVSASGNVPGYPLNQFSLDEYNNNLRIATTIGDRFVAGWGWGLGLSFGPGQSLSDVYVLNDNLEAQGSVLGLGEGERIYSVRFIEDKGYVVTFRQTDPFYVLDLSNPKKPQLKGELKIPGYSSYLHPITKDKILGIGQESWQVKISLFDVSNPNNPQEADKYTLSESWSDVLENYHAFLLDSKHQIFFLPGSQGGYIFSYKDNKLSMVKAVSGISARRAIYINDYLYIIGDDKIIVLNELNWEKVKELVF